MKRRMTLAALLMASSLVFSNQSEAAIIVNGDFETGDISGWNGMDPSIAPVSDAGFWAGGGWGSFLNGHYAVNFGGANRPAGETLWQQFSTIAGQQYVLNFDYGRFIEGSGGPQSLEVTVSNSADSAILFQTVVTDLSSASDLGALFDPYSHTFTASGSETILAFKDVSAGTHNTDGTLDNVQVAAVPEPSTLMLIGSGFAFCAFRRKLRIS